MTLIRARRGTTLIDVMAAVTVLAATVSTAGAIFPLGAFLRNGGGDYSRGAAIAQRKLEQVRQLPAESLTYSALYSAGLIDEAGSSPAPFTLTDRLAAELAGGEGTIELRGVATDLVRVEVTLTWSDVRGRPRRMSAVTQVGEKGVWVRP